MLSKVKYFPVPYVFCCFYFECGGMKQESNIIYSLLTSSLKLLKSFAAGK
jgi:hypothetical protein